MRMWALVAAALLSTLVLAGCNDNGNGDGDGSSSSSTSSAPTTSASSSSTSRSSTTSASSSSSGPAPNKAPTGSISASISSGPLPLEVNFTLAGSDPDGDVLTWDLAFGDSSGTNGALLPATVSHNYTAAGNFTAQFTLSDSKAQTTYNVTIEVKAGVGGAGQVVAGESMITNGNCLGATSGTVPSAAFFPDEQDGVTFVGFDVDPVTLGMPFTVVFTTLVDGSGALVFVDAAGAYLLRTLTGLDDQAADGLIGMVPAGAARGFLFGCANEPDPVAFTYAA